MYESKQSMRDNPFKIDPYESKHSIRMRAEMRKKQKGKGEYGALEGYQGSGVKLAGQGWRTGVGSTLAGLGILGGLGNIGTKSLEGLIGGAILSGVGAIMIHSDRKRKQKGKGASPSFDSVFEKTLRTNLKEHGMSGSGKGRLTKKRLKDLIEAHKDKPIHIRDIAGINWKEKTKELIKWLNKKPPQDGQGIFGDIGKAFKRGYKSVKKVRDKAVKELKAFAAGKTKVKPSHLLDIAAGAVGIAGAASAFIPGVDLISVPAASAAALGLKSVAHLARTSGRGVNLAGSGIPQKHQKYIYKNPHITSIIAKHAKKKKQIGYGRAAQFTAALGIAGTSAAAGAYGLYQYLLQNPGIAAKLAAKGTAKAASAWLAGGGPITESQFGDWAKAAKAPAEPPAIKGKKGYELGISFTLSGKVKRDRYSVFYGYYPKTPSGLTKAAFMKKGRKIISRKKHLAGLQSLNRFDKGKA